MSIRHVLTIHVPADETCFTLFEAASLELVTQTSDRVRTGLPQSGSRHRDGSADRPQDDQSLWSRAADANSWYVSSRGHPRRRKRIGHDAAARACRSAERWRGGRASPPPGAGTAGNWVYGAAWGTGLASPPLNLEIRFLHAPNAAATAHRRSRIVRYDELPGRGTMDTHQVGWPVRNFEHLDVPVVHLFADPCVTLGTERREVPEGSKRLLAFVALRRRRVERRQVASTLWPFGVEERAAGNLRSALWRLRRVGINVLAAKWSLVLRAEVLVDLHLMEQWAAPG